MRPGGYLSAEADHAAMHPILDLLGKLARFGAVGLFCTALYGVILLGMGHLLDTPILANHVIAFLFALPVSYGLQRQLTFRIVDGPHGRHFFRFSVLSIITLAVSTATVAIVRGYGFGELAVLAIVALIIPTMSFLMMLFWVFIDPGATGPRQSRADR